MATFSIISVTQIIHSIAPWPHTISVTHKHTALFHGHIQYHICHTDNTQYCSMATYSISHTQTHSIAPWPHSVSYLSHTHNTQYCSMAKVSIISVTHIHKVLLHGHILYHICHTDTHSTAPWPHSVSYLSKLDRIFVWSWPHCQGDSCNTASCSCLQMTECVSRS